MIEEHRERNDSIDIDYLQDLQDRENLNKNLK